MNCHIVDHMGLECHNKGAHRICPSKYIRGCHLTTKEKINPNRNKNVDNFPSENRIFSKFCFILANDYAEGFTINNKRQIYKIKFLLLQLLNMKKALQ